ncbi:hypothetical protein [Cohnella sp. WQ 127256]|uniref:hypothetical protein n=1 Tax=Cohnella sp. WQ 127256 TaxID=2938790 RepID=UPI0021188C85|nr:hypothetical protein [Cohnella sp. WQ 127256]
MKLYSEILSNVLKILLWAMVGLSAVSLVTTIIYAIDIDFYLDYAYSYDGFIDVSSSVLYYIIIVVFLIWIFRVHMDLKELFPFFTRSPGMSLACMMIPGFNIYGIPSTYLRIGDQLQTVTATNKHGKYISTLAVPLIIIFYVNNIFTRVLLKDSYPSDTQLLTQNSLLILTYVIYLVLVIQISSGLKIVSMKKTTIDTEINNLPEDDWVSNNLIKDTTDSTQKA